jgi:hypothetical protein
MGHAYLPEWIDLDGRLAGLQEVPVMLEFRAVYFRPRLDQTQLRLRHAATQALDVVDREHSGVLLVVRVKMWPMMLAAGFDEHPNDDAEES